MSMFWVWVIVGIVAGWLAKNVMREGPYGILGDLIVGVIGAFVGGWIFNYFGHPGVTGLNLGSLAVAFVGAVVFLWIVRQLSRGRSLI
jgi:uncharacterized membrane protein YeaQ/YmgE (transglycosylase-associated protein family)